MGVTPSGYMAVIIDFSGLVAARRQANPGYAYDEDRLIAACARARRAL